MTPKTTENKRAVIYARYSSSGQREASIDDQLRDCRRFCDDHGYTIVAEYFDKAMSGTTDRRPDFQRMISDSANGTFDVVVVWKIDRFGRNRYDSATYRHKLKKNGVSIVSAMEAIPEGAEGIILESLLEGMSEYYSVSLSENVRRGIYGSALKHLTLGQKYFGLRTAADGTFEPDPETAPVVKEIFDRYVNGESARSITADLNARGFKSTRGTPLGREFVVRVIHNEKYKGIYRYQDICDKCIQPIVSEDLWAAAQKVAERHAEKPAESKEEGGYLLTGILFCGECGEGMRSYSGTSRNGSQYRYYACSGSLNHRCGCPKYRKDPMEKSVTQAIKNIIFSDDIVNEYAETFMQWQKAQPRTSDSLIARLKEIDGRIANIVTAIECGNAPESLIWRLRSLETERKETLEAMDRALQTEGRIFTKAEIVRWFDLFRNGDLSDHRFLYSVIETFVESVTIIPGGVAVQLKFGGRNVECPLDPKEIADYIIQQGSGSCFDLSGRPNTAKLNISIRGVPIILSALRQ